MNIDERLEAITMSLELAMRDIEALGVRQERTSQDIQTLYATVQQDAENIRALARIAEIHERRITSLEGGEQ
jgi:hypothetical protein